jgi:hypothetical protein
VRREDAERVARLEGARLDGREVVAALRCAGRRESNLGPLRGDARRGLVELEAVAVDEVEVLLRGLGERLLDLGGVLRADLAHARAELLLDALQPLERRLVPPPSFPGPASRSATEKLFAGARFPAPGAFAGGEEASAAATRAARARAPRRDGTERLACGRRGAAPADGRATPRARTTVSARAPARARARASRGS